MPSFFVDYSLLNTTRKTIRDEVITLFLCEDPGTGNGALCSKYFYTVEHYGKYSIIIERPAWLNKGFDFTVSIPFSDHMFGGKRVHSNPSHQDVIIALLYSRTHYSSTFDRVKSLIQLVYDCQKPSFSQQTSLGFFSDRNGNLHPIEVIILAIRWLFIEQDVTYWNWSGRNMLYTALQSNKLV